MSATTAHTARSPVAATATALALGLAALIAIFWPEARAAVSVWYESTAYGHCFLVAPIAAYLLWDRRESLRGLAPEPTPALALLGLPLPLLWLAAERLGIMEGRQLVAVAAIELLFLVALGWRLFRAMSGPLLYLVFLVPFGAFITPELQSFTAHFIDVGLDLLGIPHYITDMTIEISAGTFYVAEACAGLRFLIASVAFGVFFALLNYNSPGRRAAFIAASVVIPVIANGFRALGIVTLGNILGSAQAAAADHIIYGWIFFSFVTLLLVLAGLPFREPPAAAPQHIPPAARRPRPVHPAAPILILILAAIGPATALALDSRATPARLAHLALAAPPGCRISQPLAVSADHAPPDRLIGQMDCAGRLWTLAVQAIPGQTTNAPLAEARRILSGPTEAEEVTAAPLPGAPGWQTLSAYEPGFVVASAAWIDGRPATGGLSQRLLQARNSIVGAPPSVIAVLSFRPGGDLTPPDVQQALADVQRFVAAQPHLAATLTQAAQ